MQFPPDWGLAGLKFGFPPDAGLAGLNFGVPPGAGLIALKFGFPPDAGLAGLKFGVPPGAGTTGFVPVFVGGDGFTVFADPVEIVKAPVDCALFHREKYPCC